MKKVFKSKLFQFIITAIIFTSIGTFASNILADKINYQPKNSNWEVKNVEEALNDLYNKKVDLSLVSKNGINSAASITNRTTSFNIEPGNYLVILSEYTALCPDCGNPSISLSTSNNATITVLTDYINAKYNTYSAKNYLKIYKINALENSNISIVSNDGNTNNEAAGGVSYIIMKVKQ